MKHLKTYTNIYLQNLHAQRTIQANSVTFDDYLGRTSNIEDQKLNKKVKSAGPHQGVATSTPSDWLIIWKAAIHTF